MTTKNSKLSVLAALNAVALVGLISPLEALADENGTSFWLSGQYASGASIAPAPGLALTTMGYGFRGTSNTPNTTGTLNQAVAASDLSLAFQLSYAFKNTILGARPAIGLGFGPGTGNTSVGLSTIPGDKQVYYNSQRTTGVTDLYPIANLYWNEGLRYHYMVYVTGDRDVGTYSKDKLSNIGLGHSAIDFGGGYTYTNRVELWEFSVVAGLTNNFSNTQTNYKSGIDSHLDWGVSKGFTRNWSGGLAGYAYYQLTADGGSGDAAGANKARIFAIGPQVAYLFNRGPHEPLTYLSLRGYHEFGARNRVQGNAIFAVLTVRWGEGGKHLFDK